VPILRPYFVQNKYVRHTTRAPTQEDQQRPPGAPHSLVTSGIDTAYFILHDAQSSQNTGQKGLQLKSQQM
jgi:hypothetical protein